MKIKLNSKYNLLFNNLGFSIDFNYLSLSLKKKAIIILLLDDK
jgi:hypothetical protein